MIETLTSAYGSDLQWNGRAISQEKVPQTNAMDLNTLNLDPDPEFWSNLDSDPGLCYQFE